MSSESREKCDKELMLVLCSFCKQKTAYGMRISDWSTDVCSADLRPLKKRAMGPRRRGSFIRWLRTALPGKTGSKRNGSRRQGHAPDVTAAPRSRALARRARKRVV